MHGHQLEHLTTAEIYQLVRQMSDADYRGDAEPWLAIASECRQRQLFATEDYALQEAWRQGAAQWRI